MKAMLIIDRNLKFTGPFTPRSKTDTIVLHHAAAKSCTVEDVHRWHLNNGWLGIGYHYFVSKLGGVYRGRPEDAMGAHSSGHNDHTIGICAEGDFEQETMPDVQKRAIIELVRWIVSRYPNIAIKKHKDLNATLCPGKNYPFDEIVAGAVSGTPILGQAQATVQQAQAWARSRNAAQVFIDLAPLYWLEAPLRGGVRPEVAYAQAAKETAFGRFGGVIPGPEWHNWCGLKTTSGGGNYDVNAHAKFPDDLTGVRAHLDHLALYAGAPGYPLPGTPDPRHFPYIAGTAKTVESLSGKWAGAGYGESIVRDYLVGLLATQAPVAEEIDLDEIRKEITALKGQVATLAEKQEAVLATLSRMRDALMETEQT